MRYIISSQNTNPNFHFLSAPFRDCLQFVQYNVILPVKVLLNPSQITNLYGINTISIVEKSRLNFE